MNIKALFSRTHLWHWAAAILLMVSLVIALSYLLPPAVDFQNCFKPAALEMLQGRSPFEVACFFNVPWALLPLIPISVLPVQIGRAVLFVCALIAYIFTAIKLKAKPLTLVFLLLSPPIIHDLFNGNLDWMVMLGFVLPHRIGIFFLAVKPQMSGALALFWLVEDWQAGGWRLILRNYGLAAIAFILTLLIFGMWPLRFGVGTGASWEANASLWPMSLPVGLTLMVTAFRQWNKRLAIAASPCFSPYLKLHSWGATLMAIVHRQPETIAAVVGLWILVAIRAAGGG